MRFRRINRLPLFTILLIGPLPSFIKKIVYKLKGYQIGKNVRLGFGSIILGDNVIIEDNVVQGLFSIVIGKKIIIEKFSSMGMLSLVDSYSIHLKNNSSVNEMSFVQGLKDCHSEFVLGRRSEIYFMAVLNCTNGLFIGDDVLIGGYSVIVSHSAAFPEYEGFPEKHDRILIGDKVWVQWNVTITPGVTIGSNVILESGSLIKKDIPSNSNVSSSSIVIKKKKNLEPLLKKYRYDVINELILLFKDQLVSEEWECSYESVDKQYALIKTNKSILYFHFKAEEVIVDDKSKKDACIVFFESTTCNKNYNMYIDLKEKQYYGKSYIGFKFIAYIKKFGFKIVISNKND